MQNLFWAVYVLFIFLRAIFSILKFHLHPLIGQHLSKRNHKTAKNIIRESLTNTGSPLEFALGGGVDFKTSTKIADWHARSAAFALKCSIEMK